MIKARLDLVPPIRGLESFSFSMFYCSVGWMVVFYFRGCKHILFSGLEEEIDVITIVLGDRIKTLIGCDEC